MVYDIEGVGYARPAGVAPDRRLMIIVLPGCHHQAAVGVLCDHVRIAGFLASAVARFATLGMGAEGSDKGVRVLVPVKRLAAAMNIVPALDIPRNRLFAQNLLQVPICLTDGKKQWKRGRAQKER